MIIDIKTLINKYNLVIKGVIHIGGHTGEEYNIYNELGIAENIFYEPQTIPFDIFKQKYPSAKVIKKALGSKSGIMPMYVEDFNLGASSSLLEPKLHTAQYPHITFNRFENVEVSTLDTEDIDRSLYNFINMDVQGYELEVLRGSVETLKTVDYIMTEVNNAELYANCAKIEELDLFLSDYDFRRVETVWEGGTWGDAFYIKR